MTQPPSYSPYGQDPQPYGGHPGYPAYPGYGQSGDGRPPSRAMAGWALGLALAFCVPLATLVSIGLAIAVLVQSRDGRDRGRGLAVAALVIDALVVLGLVALVVVAVVVSPGEPERDSAGRVTERQEVSTFKIREGDCLVDPALMAAGDERIEVGTTEVVPCDESHDVEAYFVFDLEGDEYPGEARTVRRAAVGCLAEFRPFVGRAYAASDLDFWTYYPQRRSWEVIDDRTVICLVGDPGEKTTGTLEGSGR